MEGCNRGVWDQAIIERLLAGRYRPPCWPDFVHHDTLADVPDAEGAVVVLPARHHTSLDDLRRLNEMTTSLPWLLLILNGDEEHTFPYGHVDHPNMRLWVQTPDSTRTYPAGTRFLANGPAPLAYETPWGERTRDVVLLAQDTHARRHACADAVQAILDAGRPGHLTRAAGFTQGVEPAEYMALMASARVCPAPSGPVCVDSFRAWEAMELGAVPVLDGYLPDGTSQATYWQRVIGILHPALFVVRDWQSFLPWMVDKATVWPGMASRAAVWWQHYQRDMAHDLVADLRDLGAPLPDPAVGDQITVLMPTSPIPSHPSTAVIEETIDSVRAQLPTAEILVMCDGVRPAQNDRRQAYEEYLYELVRLCRERWSNVLPIIHGEHLHQSGMTRHALDLVTTPTVLFCEHDTPIRGSVPWRQMVDAITDDSARVIRLHHEARIHPEHEHLMLGPSADIRGVQMAPSQQWSQRPHLALTDLYRRAIADHFAGKTCMVEDVLHGVVQTDTAQGNWGRWKLHILTEPNGEHGMRRSWHTDGRQGDDKWIGDLR
jgi:hypothetical protein